MTNYLELYYKVNKNSQNSIKELNTKVSRYVAENIIHLLIYTR